MVVIGHRSLASIEGLTKSNHIIKALALMLDDIL